MTPMKDRLKQVRQTLGKSQRDMATLLNISYKGWQGYEAGDNVPGGNVLASLAKLGFNINWVLTGEGPMTIEQSAIPSVEIPADLAAIRAKVPVGLEAVIGAVIEVMTSDDEGTKLALLQNAFTFQQTVRYKKEVDELKSDMAAIKRRLLGSPETDFKPMEEQREKHRAGGES